MPEIEIEDRTGEEVLYPHKVRINNRTHTVYLWGIIIQTNQKNYSVKCYDLVGDDTQDITHYNKSKLNDKVVFIGECEGYCHQKEGKLYFGF